MEIQNFIMNMKAKQAYDEKRIKRMNDDFAIMMLKIKHETNDDIRIIEGFENYCVSDNGIVYNLKFGKKLRPQLTGKPDKLYYAVSLYKDRIVTQLQIHRLVALAFIPNNDPDVKILVDHKNNDALNNNVSNLRWSTHSQNNQNVSKQKNTSSYYKGVAYHEQKQKWQAYIRVDKKLKHLGYFHNEKEAARTYDEHAKEKFGEFAKLNF